MSNPVKIPPSIETARVVALCVGKASPLFFRHDNDPSTLHAELSAIKKHPVSTLADPSSVNCRRLGLEGDEQADLSVHGGPLKAIYCYPFEHYEFWRQHNAALPGDTDPFGVAGENLCSNGLTESEVWIGDRWKVGEVELCVTAPRVPCYKFNARLSLKNAAKLMVKNSCCGWYMSVMKEGKIKAGDVIVVTPGSREISVAHQNTWLARS